MVPTSDTSEVIVDILVKSGGVDLLSVEVLEVLLKDLICSLVSLAKVLQDLKRKIFFKTRVARIMKGL